jgi:hypothetical protein
LILLGAFKRGVCELSGNVKRSKFDCLVFVLESL